MILTSPPCLLRCRTWNKKTTEFAWTPLASCSSSLHQQQRSQSSLKVYGLAQLGKRGEDYGVWCQQLRPKCCKRGHRLLQHWRFRGGALWPRRDLRANWLRQLACGLSRVWHQLLVRWLCHNNRGSKSTAMRQQLQMHQLYRSLACEEQKCGEATTFMSMGCSSTYISYNGVSSSKAYVSGVCTSPTTAEPAVPSTAAPAAPSTTTPYPTWDDYTALISAEGRVEVSMALVLLLGYVWAGKYCDGMFDIGREAVKCHWSVLWLVGDRLWWWSLYLHQLASAVSAQLNCHWFYIMLNFLAYEIIWTWTCVK